MQTFISRLVAIVLAVILVILVVGKAHSQTKYDADPLDENSPAFKMHGWLLYDIVIDAATREVVEKKVADGYEKPFNDLVQCLVEQHKTPMMRSGDKLLGRACAHDTKKDT
jgi:hypothetical protein